MRLASVVLFTDFTGDYPMLALPPQQRAEARFTGAVGWRGVDQVNAQVMSLRQQVARRGITGDGKAVGVLHPLVTP